MRILIIIIPIFVLILAFPSFAADFLRGRAIYETNCSSCHGKFGKGDGPRAEEFDPQPTNFIDPEIMTKITPERFEKAVVQGLPNVAEHSFGHLLNPEEVKDLIKYVRSLNR